MEQKLKPQILRKLTYKKAELLKSKRDTFPIYLVLDNVYDTFNTGALFRLADATGVREIILCGMTETPPNKKLAQSSIGLDKIVPWRYFRNISDAIDYLKKQSCYIVSLEQDKRAKQYNKVDYKIPLAIIVGNETYGVSEEALANSDIIVQIPMYGYNTSLNVAVATGILLYTVLDQIITKQ